MKKWVILCGCCLLFSQPAWAVKLPRWEWGVGYFDGLTAHYFGANQYYHVQLPLPYFNFRTETLQVGDSNKFYIWKGESSWLDLSFSGRLAVRSESTTAAAPENVKDSKAVIVSTRNYARRGMDDLPWVLFAGVRYFRYLNDHLYMELPYFAGIPIGSAYRDVGQFYEPTINFDFFPKQSSHGLILSASQLFGSATYNQFYYGVPAKDVLADRPEYKSKAGLVVTTYGISLVFDLSRRLRVLAGGYRHDMRSSTVKSSPLVVAKVSNSILFGIIYKFGISEELVEVSK
ncbi:MAG: hypothetical protein COB67_12665 [SAR324 cluster bacterium]|uniref:MipA/OmpV family protein n=1 Tax=SAR324 cluster bacterium TaxID=2024889 RepID=A0A2A4SQV5_9DELT|nr:MAG: hypothetical protein COB67_12665 [SAR324 cluster bacterium]